MRGQVGLVVNTGSERTAVYLVSTVTSLAFPLLITTFEISDSLCGFWGIGSQHLEL